MRDRLSQLLFLQWVLFLIISLAYDHFAWADQQKSGYSLIIKSAQYDVERQDLKVKVSLQGERPYQVELIDIGTGTQLARKTVRKGVLKFKLKNIQEAEVPCVIEVRMYSLVHSLAVENSSEDCRDKQYVNELNDVLSDVTIDDFYRNDLDKHLKLGCDSCHGSSRAILSDNKDNNVTAAQLQRHVGTISECITCHQVDSFPNGTLQGPHGMHPVNEPSWIDAEGHGKFAGDRRKGDRCATCHGADHLGTRLAKVPVNRALRDSEGELLAIVSTGAEIACDLCHGLAKSFAD